jgi:hypothetical protein
MSAGGASRSRPAGGDRGAFFTNRPETANIAALGLSEWIVYGIGGKLCGCLTRIKRSWLKQYCHEAM